MVSSSCPINTHTHKHTCTLAHTHTHTHTHTQCSPMSPDSIFTKCLSLVIKTKQKQKTNSSTCFCRHRLCCPSYVAVLGCTLGDGEFCQGHDKALQGCLKDRKS